MMERNIQKNPKINNDPKTDRPRAVCAALFGLMSAAALGIGYSMEKYGAIQAAAMLVFAVVLLFAAPASYLVMGILDRRSMKEPPHDEKTGVHGPAGILNRFDRLAGAKKAALIFLLLMACYLVVLLAVYPGFFVYDAYEELNMFRTGVFTTHHPLCHVLITGGVISAVHALTGSWNAGIFVYSLLQAACIAAVFTYMLHVLHELGISLKLRTLSVLWLALFPTVVMFVLCTCKDGIFAASLLMTVLELLLFFREPAKFLKNAVHPALYTFFAALLMLYRHNGLYAYVVFIPFFLLLGRGRRGEGADKERLKKFLKKAALAVLPLILALGINSGLKACTGAAGGEHQEAFSVPIQQLVRTCCYEPESFTEEEKEILYRYIPENYVSHYNAKLSDPVKVGFVNEAYDEDSASFIRLWLTKGLQHPLSYLNAWFSTCYGQFYPWTVIDCYKGQSVFTIIYEDSSYFGFETEEPGTRQSLLPLLEKIYRHFSLDAKVQKIPVFRFFYSPGGMALIFLFVILYAAATRRTCAFAALLPVFLTYLTVLLGPCSLPRYVCYFWFMLPLTAAVLFDKGALKDRSEEA